QDNNRTIRAVRAWCTGGRWWQGRAGNIACLEAALSCQRLRFAVVGFWCVLVGLVSAAPALEVSNFADGQTIRYPVPLLLGSLSKSAEGISVVNRTHPRAEAIAGQ